MVCQLGVGMKIEGNEVRQVDASGRHTLVEVVLFWRGCGGGGVVLLGVHGIHGESRSDMVLMRRQRD